MVCLFPSGSFWTFWCWLKEHKLFSQTGPTGGGNYSVVCRLNSADHACHWLWWNAPLQCPLATIFFPWRKGVLGLWGQWDFMGLTFVYSVIFLACAPKLACVFWSNRVFSDLARKASTSTDHLLLAELPMNPPASADGITWWYCQWDLDSIWGERAALSC